MGTVDGMLNEMRKLLGTGENPPGSNHNFITTWYGVDAPWCDMTVSYAAEKSGNRDAIGRFSWTVQHAEFFRSAGRWHYGLGGIRAGDVIFFDWDGQGSISAIDHVGVVEACHADGTVTTIEGNSSDVCARRKRGGSTVVGYGRPAYGDAAPMPSTDGTLRRGSTGEAVRTLQRNLNTVIGAGLAVDGDFGPATEAAVKAFQKKYAIEIDGIYGPQSAATMGAALAGQSTPTPPTPTSPPSTSLAVDGVFGPATCKALQSALNGHGAQLAVDGDFGPLTKRALQAYLKVTVDGQIGPITVKALQQRVGATVDGDWGPETTRQLQRALNANQF